MKTIDKQGNLYYDRFKNGFDGNVQGVGGICQCITASNGGVYPHCQLRIARIGGCYWNQQEQYVRRPLWGISRTLKADGGHPAGIIIEYY
jgi:hypothetical protein